MRYSRMENSRHKQPGGPRKAWFFVAFVLVIGVGVYTIGAAKVGNFISEKIVTPVVAWVTGEDAKNPDPANPSASAAPSPSPSEAAPSSTATVTLKGGTIYALQAGIFADEANANALATTLSGQGGAGYVLADTEGYRVLIAGYQTEGEAESVKNQLKSEQQMETKQYAITSAETKFRITADTATIASVQAAMEGAMEYQEALLPLSISLDKGETKAEDAKTQIAQLREKAENMKKTVDEIASSTDNKTIKSISQFYGETVTALQGVGEGLGDIELSAKIKYTYLAIGVAGRNLSDALNAAA